MSATTQATIEPSAKERLLAQFEVEAKTAQVQESDLRRKLAAEIARLERQRVYAFRRIRLIKTLIENARSETTEGEAPSDVQLRAVAEDLGWSSLSESYSAILERLRPLATAVQASLTSNEDTGEVARELSLFDSWFEETHKKSFFALYDQYVSEVPVVDF